MSQIEGTVNGPVNMLKITSDGRALVDSIDETVSAERSRKGKLFGVGTGTVNPTAGDLRSVMWSKNTSATENMHIQKIIFGWNGGSTTWNKTAFSLILYNTGAPTANNTLTTDSIENVSLSGVSSAVSSGDTTNYVWDGVSTGMTSGSGGFSQIGNRLSKGNTSIPIDGEIILGPGNSMEFQVLPEEDGLFNVAIVYYFAPINGGRSAI